MYASLFFWVLCYSRIYFPVKGACDQVDRAFNSRSEGLGHDSQCWTCVEVSGKLHIPHCFCPLGHNGYLVHRYKVGSIVAGCIGAHLAREKVKYVLSWSLDSKQLLLPLPLNRHPLAYRVYVLEKVHAFEITSDLY